MLLNLLKDSFQLLLQSGTDLKRPMLKKPNLKKLFQRKRKILNMMKDFTKQMLIELNQGIFILIIQRTILSVLVLLKVSGNIYMLSPDQNKYLLITNHFLDQEDSWLSCSATSQLSKLALGWEGTMIGSNHSFSIKNNCSITWSVWLKSDISLSFLDLNSQFSTILSFLMSSNNFCSNGKIKSKWVKENSVNILNSNLIIREFTMNTGILKRDQC